MARPPSVATPAAVAVAITIARAATTKMESEIISIKLATTVVDRVTPTMHHLVPVLHPSNK